METNYKIVTSHSAEGLSIHVDELRSKGWTPIGSHQVVTLYAELTYSGSQHRRTIYEREYSQTMVKKVSTEITQLGDLTDQQIFGKKQ